MQIELSDFTLAGEAQRLRARVNRAGCTWFDRGAHEIRSREPSTASDKRVRELPADIVIERQQALDVRHRNRLGDPPQVERARRALKAERKRLVDADRAPGRFDLCAV